MSENADNEGKKKREIKRIQNHAPPQAADRGWQPGSAMNSSSKTQPRHRYGMAAGQAVRTTTKAPSTKNPLSFCSNHLARLTNHAGCLKARPGNRSQPRGSMGRGNTDGHRQEAAAEPYSQHRPFLIRVGVAPGRHAALQATTAPASRRRAGNRSPAHCGHKLGAASGPTESTRTCSRVVEVVKKFANFFILPFFLSVLLLIARLWSLPLPLSAGSLAGWVCDRTPGGRHPDAPVGSRPSWPAIFSR